MFDLGSIDWEENLFEPGASLYTSPFVGMAVSDTCDDFIKCNHVKIKLESNLACLSKFAVLLLMTELTMNGEKHLGLI